MQTANNDVVKVPCVNATPSDKYDLCAQYSKRVSCTVYIDT